MERRTFVKTAGGLSLVGLAGCIGGNSDNGGSSGNGSGGGGGTDFPTDDLRFVVPYSEGGGSDLYARQIGPLMGDVIGEPYAIENQEGSGGMIGTREVATADRGGHDLLTHNLPTIALEYLQQGIDSFDLNDFRDVGVGIYAHTPRMTIKNPNLEIDTYEEFLEEAPNLSYGHPGGTELAILQVAGDLHGLEVGDSVSYDGGADAAQAVASGELDVASAPEGNFPGPIESGDVEPFFVWPSTGSNLYPDLSSPADEGYEEFDWLSNTQRVLWTNPGTSEEVLDELEAALQETMESDEMTAWSEETGQHITFQSREDANQGLADSIEGMQNEIDLDEL